MSGSELQLGYNETNEIIRELLRNEDDFKVLGTRVNLAILILYDDPEMVLTSSGIEEDLQDPELREAARLDVFEYDLPSQLKELVGKDYLIESDEVYGLGTKGYAFYEFVEEKRKDIRAASKIIDILSKLSKSDPGRYFIPRLILEHDPLVRSETRLIYYLGKMWLNGFLESDMIGTGPGGSGPFERAYRLAPDVDLGNLDRPIKYMEMLRSPF